jgi:hypothetical protein
MAPRVLAPKLIQVRAADEGHLLECPHCIKERIRRRQVLERVQKIVGPHGLRFKGTIELVIEIVKTMLILALLTIPMLLLAVASACCRARKNKSALEEDLEHMTAVSPRALAERMPEAPTDKPHAVAYRTRRRSQLAS